MHEIEQKARKKVIIRISERAMLRMRKGLV